MALEYVGSTETIESIWHVNCLMFTIHYGIRNTFQRYVVQAVVQVGLALLQTDVYVIVQLLALTAE